MPAGRKSVQIEKKKKKKNKQDRINGILKQCVGGQGRYARPF